MGVSGGASFKTWSQSMDSCSLHSTWGSRSAAFLQIVVYLVLVLVREGVAFCHKLQQKGIDVPGVRDSWFGLKNDLSDPQWRDFRNSMPLLTVLMAAFVGLSRLVSLAGGRVAVPLYLVHMFYR
jgi:hypothetical protein